MEYKKDTDLEENHLLENGPPQGYVSTEEVYTHSEPVPPAKDAFDGDTLGRIDSIKRCTVRRYKWVEPTFFFFQLAIWSNVPLRNQFVYARLLQKALQDISDVTGVSYDHLTNTIEHGRSFNYTHVVTPGQTNYTNILPYTSQEDFWNHLKSSTSVWIIYLELLTSGIGLVTNLIICAYSDIAGRKVGLALPTISLAAEAVIYIIVSYFHLSISYLAIGHLLEGLCGSHLTLSGTAYAYLADITPEASRTLRFALLNAILLFSCMAGNVIVGILINYYGFTNTYCFIVVLCLLSFLYTMIFLQETVANLDGRFSIREIARTTLSTFKIYSMKRDNVENGRTQLLVLLFLMFLQALLLLGMIDLQTVYLVGPPMKFNSVKLGIFLAVSALANAIGPVLAIGVFRKWVSDNTIALFSSLLTVVGYFMYAFIESPNWLFAGK